MLTKEDIEAFEYYNQEDRKESYLPQTPLGMVKEYQDLSRQKADPALYSALIDEEFSEWVNETRMGMSYSSELKELADLVYVIFGYANAKGWDLDEALRRVHENNVGRMYQPDGTIKRREDGKIVKNASYPKVDLSNLINKGCEGLTKYEVWVDLSEQGYGSLVTLDNTTNEPMVFDNEYNAKDMARHLWGEHGFIKEQE